MLTKLVIRNFKMFGDVEIELGNPVLFIGPNNSGKTTALQALALWDVGVKRWLERRPTRGRMPQKRPGVTINRRDLISLPLPIANLIWRNLHVRDVRSVGKKQQISNVFVDILVDGVTEGKRWSCGLEFYYANEESFYCRPLRLSDAETPKRMEVPEEAGKINVAFFHPMSGLAANETRLDRGAINVRIGEGRTAEVLRNLCLEILTKGPGEEKWTSLCQRIRDLFLVEVDRPTYIVERGEIIMSYRHVHAKERLDLSASGRGFQQTLLLLAFLTRHPGSVLLLDEPDAHLEILRQRQIYQVLTEVARSQNSQIIAASHSEVLMTEAAGRDVMVAFVGKPHRVAGRESQVLKSLKDIGYDQYYQAEQTGWVLYLEGSTDLAILRAFARALDHPAAQALERPFVHYVGNQPQKARDHFFGLQEAKPELVGFALFDRLDGSQKLQNERGLREKMWSRREIENYLCTREGLLAWAEHCAREQGPLFGGIVPKWVTAMDEVIAKVEGAMDTLGQGSPWSVDTKVSDNFLAPLFEGFHKKLDLPNLMSKAGYHELVEFIPASGIDPEVRQVLDAIVEVSSSASPEHQA